MPLIQFLFEILSLGKTFVAIKALISLLQVKFAPLHEHTRCDKCKYKPSIQIRIVRNKAEYWKFLFRLNIVLFCFRTFCFKDDLQFKF